MSELAVLIRGDLDAWLAALPDFQKNLIRDLLAAGTSPDDVPAAWIRTDSGQTTAPYGAGRAGRDYYESFQDEIHDLLCSDTRYQQERAELAKSLNIGPTAGVAYVSAFITSILPTSAIAIAPAVATLMFVIARMGLGAWCRTQTRRRQERGANAAERTDAAP